MAAVSGRRILAVLRRTAIQAAPAVFGIVVLNFLLLQCLPGDAVDVLAAEFGGADASTIDLWRRHFGLDQGLLVQLGSYLWDLVRLDLGVSPRHNRPVFDLIAARLGNTLLLTTTALVVAFVAGIALGAVMASWAGRWQDRAGLHHGPPALLDADFWLGLMAIVVFSVKLGWLPTGGNRTLGASLEGWPLAVDVARHLVLPAIAMAGFFVALFARLTRAAMLEAARQDYVRTARAKGLRPLAVTLRHVLRNALVPVTTVAGLHSAAMLGGAIVVETVFGWPGLGRLAFEVGVAARLPRAARHLASVLASGDRRQRARRSASRKRARSTHPGRMMAARMTDILATPDAAAGPAHTPLRGALRELRRNPAACAVIVVLAAAALVAMLRGSTVSRRPARHGRAATVVARRRIRRFPLGSDSLGRDVAAGIAHGARVSLAVGAVAASAQPRHRRRRRVDRRLFRRLGRRGAGAAHRTVPDDPLLPVRDRHRRHR